MGFIYRLTSPSNKSYIGQTIRPIEERFKEHQKSDSYCVAIYRAIQKHKWENMTKEWFEVPDEDLNFYEEMLVALLGTLSPGGYNLKEGGGSGGRMCEESREKMSIATSGDKNPFYRKSHTDEAREKISNAKKGKTLSDDHKQKMSDSRKGANNYNYGKTLSDFQKQQISKAKKGKPLSVEHRQKMSDSHKGEKHHRSKKMYQYEFNGTFVQSFASSGEAARSLNKTSSNIRSCARGERESAYGFKWSYIELL
ncbi:hypothetical protein ATCV1_Z641L [Acanthocystis turfacea chlorella virus 1]|uniref:Uncharacterized protein Z641L n=1 Tax=Chlorovirus heliozoae TaxID=322019 RepID=A7K9Q1_9PHYC|nr:hypothetical protein ATCV1_Z641L [Acanthocystis turfacea chlorella virus 1]ABT16775.1 hypothetical protein ATCV1_Z641L [Acanthocystis turfacea chlorella virus 1]